MRMRRGSRNGELAEMVELVNSLARRLSQQRSESVESQMLLNTVIDHIDVAIVAIDENNGICFYNPAAKKLFKLDKTNANQSLPAQIEFAQAFSAGNHRVVELNLHGQQGRYNVHVEAYRDSGYQRKLLFITDVSTLLRSEERKAWRNLVRVISHEINNSLTPIASISQTLKRIIEKQQAEPGAQELIEGLTIISERATGLGEFVKSYRQLSKLPDPKREWLPLRPFFERIKHLFEKMEIRLDCHAELLVCMDPVQMEQVFINILKNAIESIDQAGVVGLISIKCEFLDSVVRMTISDNGAGISNPDNLFVPFYSTKKHGSGIGLVLCRQIVETHKGHFSIVNRQECVGCQVVLELPAKKDDRSSSNSEK